ncbi:MAG: hypothetical protein JO112_22375 [Planctomycetes bacterium]|nr:hypothetical protein [Planctomycetota bacterium]
MVQVLEAQRPLGPEAYPLTLQRLAELADATPSPELLSKAIGKKQFKDRILVAQKKSLQTPVALVEDVEQLADSPLLLDFVLESACRPEQPTVPLSQLKTGLESRLKKPFEEAVQRRLQENALPDGVGFLFVRKKPSLFLRRWPPPPPPKKPEVELAEKLVQILSARQGPIKVSQLLALAGIEADAGLVKKTLASKVFKDRALLLLPKAPDSLAALVDEAVQLAGHPLVLEAVLEAARTERIQAFSPADLKKKLLPSLQSAFEEAVRRQMETETLPPTVGWLGLKSGKVLFQIRDVHAGGQVPGPTPPAVPVAPAQEERPAGSMAAAHFAAAFDEAFDRLDRQAGSHNFVSLVDLRRAVPVDRTTFDAELRQLRLADRYTLSAAEGRHGISTEEREAGLPEEGALLLFVSRRSS